MPSGNRIELFTRSGNTATPDETWSAVVGRVHERGRLADHQPEDPLPAVAGRADRQGRRSGADVGHAPRTCSATCGPQVRSVTVHPPGIVFQKPYTTGEPDLAGFEDQTTPERKLAHGGGAARQRRPRSDAVPIRRVSKRCSGAPTTRTTTNWSTTCCSGAKGETSWKTLRKAVADTILVWDTNTVPNGTYFIKVVASDGPSNPAASR